MSLSRGSHLRCDRGSGQRERTWSIMSRSDRVRGQPAALQERLSANSASAQQLPDDQQQASGKIAGKC